MIYDGGLGETLEVRDDGVVITPKGVLGVMNRGLKNDKFILFTSITAVQFKEAGLTTGYIQFTVPGGIENNQGMAGSWSDENTVNFNAACNDTFRAIRDYIQARIGPKGAAPSSAAEADAVAEGLGRFADLRDRGVITPEEFEAQKRALLAPRLPEPGLPPPPASQVPVPSAASSPRTPAWAKWAVAGCVVCLLGATTSFVVLGTRIDRNNPGDSGNAAQAALASIGAPLAVESTTLARDYSADPVQAERTYRNQGMHISGLVEDVVRDGGKVSAVELRGTGGYPTIRIDLADDDGKTIEPHRRVTFNCDGASNASGRPEANGCIPM